MLFHMLRAQMGDVAFKSALRDFYFQFAEKTARIEDFENIAERRAQAAAKPPQDPPNLRGFFAQWLTFNGRAGVLAGIRRVPHAEGISRRWQDQAASGHLSHAGGFAHRYGRKSGAENHRRDRHGIGVHRRDIWPAKPGGIKIDPNNLILKGSTTLRARAAIARGEISPNKADFTMR